MQQVEPWYSVEEIANHLGLSKETIYRWLEREAIPAHRIGKLWKFKPSEVDQWIINGGASDKDALSRKSKTSAATEKIEEYPPDLQEKATQLVLEQAEELCKDW